MMWVLIAAAVVVGFALAWWSSGRAKPRFAVTPEESIRRTQGEVVTDRAPHQGPGPVA